ncbi:MAG: ABC transporter ATP-binding protein [SAR324 cluster bacterium]|nr:ABC transporter ATP-binding protein [SAR324 cluster bacterium]
MNGGVKTPVPSVFNRFKMTLLAVENLYKHFPINGGLFLRKIAQASVINGISLAVERGEILGIVGESGCGKSTLARLIMRILEPTNGTIQFAGLPAGSYSRKNYYHRVQMVFQDPFSSLNPKMTVDAILTEMIRLHQPEADLVKTRATLLDEVGLPQSAGRKYPHEFSGGQRQRIAIARALGADPILLIADEPVSALDVSIQAQILNLLNNLQEHRNLSLVFISHDLEIIDYFCDRILVMYLGKIVEELAENALHTNAQHPYTQALLHSMPHPDKRETGLKILKGELPSPLDLPKGCSFYSRCAVRKEMCERQTPELIENFPSHKVACWDVHEG